MQYFDRVQETTTTAGAGTVTLAGASSAYRTYASAVPDGKQVANCYVDGTAWEVSLGTFSLGANTMSRDTLLASSTGAFLVLSGGATTIFNTDPAQQADYPTVNTVVGAPDVVTVQAGRQLVVADSFTVHGTLVLHGDLTVV